MKALRLLRAAPGAFIALSPLAALLAPPPAYAGPPFLTDDPEPTNLGHWEIYAPFADTSGRGGAFDGGVGAELNYGAAPNLQLTLGLPLSYTHGASGSRLGRGDLEASAKYRFYHSEAAGLSVAAFPGVTVPTAGRGLGAGKVTAFLPVWAQKDMGHCSVFGGGGYALNPGAGNRNYWTGGVAVTRNFSKRLLIGLEADRQGADTIEGHGSTAWGLGSSAACGRRSVFSPRPARPSPIRSTGRGSTVSLRSASTSEYRASINTASSLNAALPSCRTRWLILPIPWHHFDKGL